MDKLSARFLIFCCACMAPVLALAQHEHGGHGAHGVHDGGHSRSHAAGPQNGLRWHGDIRHFHQGDYGQWRSGHWFHGRHGGRLGWWWMVGPVWYFYPAPVYPYPDPFQPPAVGVPLAPSSLPPQFWYYCDNPSGYYPYVPRCRGNWRALPATPP